MIVLCRFVECSLLDVVVVFGVDVAAAVDIVEVFVRIFSAGYLPLPFLLRIQAHLLSPSLFRAFACTSSTLLRIENYEY